MRLASTACALGALAVCATTTLAQEVIVRGDLARRGMFGVQLAPAAQGLLIGGTTPGSAAAAAGVRAGDVLVEVDGVAHDGGDALMRALGRARVAEPARLVVLRDAERVELPVTPAPRPLESHDGCTTIYDAVDAAGAEGGALRTITMIPDGAGDPAPAVLFVQGLSCASIEESPGGYRGVIDLCEGLAGGGCIVMRVEKPGMGDATGPDCGSIGFDEECDNFLGALRALKSMDGVDADRVFIFGHSMGGIIGPVIAGEEPVAGVAVFGTGAIGWDEYLLQNSRRQGRLAGTPPAELEAAINEQQRFNQLMFEEGLSPAEIGERHPELAEVAAKTAPDGETIFTRHYTYFIELNDANFAEAWSSIGDAHALAMVGEYDWVTDPYDHEYIADIVNSVSSGRGEWAVLPKMFHGFDLHESMQDSLANPFQGEFGDEVVTRTVEWMDRVSAGLSRS